MSEESRDYEKEALADGWNPNFEGEGKVDAKTFVERGEKIQGMLKGKIGRLEDKLESQSHTFAEFKQYTDRQIAKEKRDKEKLISELQEVRAQAITDGDGKAAVKAEQEIESLKESNEPPADQNAYNQLAQSWANENKWYATNTKLSAFADGIADRIINEGYTGQAYFSELTRRTKEAFPDEFENPNRNKANAVESGGDKEAKDGKTQNWANLPDSAKKEANRFIKDIPGFTKEQYLSQYEWE